MKGGEQMDIGSLLAATKDFSGVWQLMLNLLGVIVASSIVIEISPIKINPVKKVFQWISKSFKTWFQDVIDSSLEKSLAEIKEDDKRRDEAVTSLTEKVDQITQRLDANEARAQQNHISLIRNQILTFSESLRSGQDASKESFDNILEAYDEYETYVEENHISNGRMSLSIAFIKEQYSQRFNKIVKQVQ